MFAKFQQTAQTAHQAKIKLHFSQEVTVPNT